MSRPASSGSASASAGTGASVESLDLAGELARDVGQLAERAGDRAQRDTLERLAESANRGVEALPQLAGSAARAGAGPQLVRELHVSGSRMRTMREPELIRVTKRRGFLLGRVGDRPHALRETLVGRSLHARLERIAPPLIGELHLLERDARIGAHDASAGPLTVMMWSASFLGAAGRESSADSRPTSAGPEDASWRTYAGEASVSRARSTSDRRTRHVRPARTAARRPELIHTRTVAGCSFNSSLTCGTVSQGSSSTAGFGRSGISALALIKSLDHLDTVDNS